MTMTHVLGSAKVSDPSLGTVLAAKRLAERKGHPFDGVVADARHLSFREDAVEAVFSYSVPQYFSKADARRAFGEIARVANSLGVRSLPHLLLRGFRKPKGFEVRYWTPWELRDAFHRAFGNAEIEVDCYFGLGLQPSDAAINWPFGRVAVKLSEILREKTRALRPLVFFADSLYLTAWNAPQDAGHRRT